jgi:heme/copper-type cytochrome/quinol oxidase subunit 2
MVKRSAKSQAGPLVFGLIAVAVLGVAGYLFASGFVSKQLPPAPNTIDISAGMDGFNRSEIHVKIGKPITIRLTSLDTPYHTDGGGKHQWAVDDFNVSVIAPPQGTNAVTFTPDKVGTYTYYCDICCGGRANPTMQGKLVVEA